MLCSAICFSTSFRLGPYDPAFNDFCKSQRHKLCNTSSSQRGSPANRVKAQTDQFFIQQRTPVDLLRQIQTQHLVVQVPVGGAVPRPAIVKISHTDNIRSQSSISQRVGSSQRDCGNDTLLASISRWHATYRVLGVSPGMHACFCVCVCDTPE